jgi:hypothetical protein
MKNDQASKSGNETEALRFDPPVDRAGRLTPGDRPGRIGPRPNPPRGEIDYSIAKVALSASSRNLAAPVSARAGARGMARPRELKL